jgi:hypothetical protein
MHEHYESNIKTRKHTGSQVSIDSLFFHRLLRLSWLLVFGQTDSSYPSFKGRSDELRSFQYIWRRYRVLVFLLLVILLNGIREGCSYYVGLIPSHFYETLLNHDKKGYTTLFFSSCGLFVAIAMVG